MTRQRINRILSVMVLGLLLLLSHRERMMAQTIMTGIPQRQPTILTAENSLVTNNDNATTTMKLTTNRGLPIAGATIMVSGSSVPHETLITDTNGEALWHFPPAFPHGRHAVKLVFAGTETLQPAIAVLRIELQPGKPATSAPAPRVDNEAAPTKAVERPEPRVVLSQRSVRPVVHANAPTEPSPAVERPITVSALITLQGWLSTWVAAPIIHWVGGWWGLPLTSPPALELWALLAVVAPTGYFVGWRVVRMRRSTATKRTTHGTTQHLVSPRIWQLPLPLWYGARVLSVGFALSIAMVLLLRPAVGLTLFWRLLIPLLPLLFFVAPGLWRNICPMAALNQSPRLFHLTRAWTPPRWFQRYGYLISISLFLVLVASRKVLFNTNASALAILLLCALMAALVTGVVFKGKSGWCSSICPLLPVQRIYGQTPFVTVAHAHCEPCLGCTKNCYDLSPHNAYLADLYDEEPNHARFRKAFVGFFPGFVLAFYLTPNPPTVAVWQVYALLFAGGLTTLAMLLLIEMLARADTPPITSNKITVFFGAAALNCYYWFNAPTLGSWVATPAPDWFVWPLRTLVFALTLFWIYRTYRKEATFIEFALAPTSQYGTVSVDPLPNQQGMRASNGAASRTAQPTLTIAPAGTCLTVAKNRTLLELCEQHNLPIEAGCRMGLCGADPICVLEGMENLSRISDEERKTLERLALAPNTRMACMARVRGDVKVALTPEQPDIYRSSVITGFRYNKAVQRVVIVGNGIAGVTAADHIRRRHPHCEIHLIGRERYPLYNRMGITRLIYGRSAMQGLMLLPEQWYEDFNITSWLNTQVQQIDSQQQTVTLGTGETLAYDRLILTTGSQSYVPPLVGFGMQGSFVLRTAEDAMAIRTYVQDQPCHHAVISGGGLLGLEAAYGLRQVGLQVTVLERSAALLTRQLDKAGSDHLLAHLAAQGIHVRLAAEASALERGEPAASTDAAPRIQRLILRNGASLPCDLLLVAAGIRPELALARTMKLTVRRGVVVDAQMRTSDPHVFAAGDVAEYNDTLLGLWPIAVSQAEVAAANAVAEEGVVAANYTEMVPVTMLKVVGIDLTSIGRIHAEAATDQVLTHEEVAEHRYRKLIIADNRIVGAILLGYPELAPGVAAAVKDEINMAPHLAALQAGDWSLLQELA